MGHAGVKVRLEGRRLTPRPKVRSTPMVHNIPFVRADRDHKSSLKGDSPLLPVERAP